jgi:hypothetical protein
VKGQPRPGGLNDPRGAAVLMHGLTPVQVVLAGHDPRWAIRFAARAAELRRVLGERARLVEHVGSTAVPGLASKPVVDILIGIDDPDDEAAYLPDLEAAGYDLTVREPQHRCLRAGDPGEPVNLHCYPPGIPRSASCCCSGITCAATLVTGGATRRSDGNLQPGSGATWAACSATEGLRQATALRSWMARQLPRRW